MTSNGTKLMNDDCGDRVTKTITNTFNRIFCQIILSWKNDETFDSYKKLEHLDHVKWYQKSTENTLFKSSG